MKSPRSLLIAAFSLALPLLCGPIFPRCVLACDTASDATPDSDCVVMERSGVKGVWLNLERADEYRKLRLAEPELKLQIDLAGRRQTILEWQIEQYSEVLSLDEANLAAVKESLETMAQTTAAAKVAENKAREELNVWYRNPAIWAAFGALVVVGVGTALR